MVRKAKDGDVRRGPSGQTVNPFVGSLYGGPRRRTTISGGLSRSLLGVPNGRGPGGGPNCPGEQTHNSSILQV